MSSSHSGRPTDLKAIALRTIDEKDCRAFIAQLTDYAIDSGQQLDDEWIAEIAAIRMLDDALDWYTDLDAETQESWKKLRKAMLKEAKLLTGGSTLRTSLAAAPLPALVPTPAAVPGNTPSTNLAIRFARIRVKAADQVYSGYLSSALAFDGSIQVTTEASSALTARYNPTDDFPVLNITNPGHENTALGFHWDEDPKQRDENILTGQLVIVKSTPPTTSSWTMGKGPCDTTAFLILPNSSLLTFSGGSSDKSIMDAYTQRDTNYLQFCVSYDERIHMGGLGEYLSKAKLKLEFL